MAMNSSSGQLSLTQIVKEAFKLTHKNTKIFILIVLSAVILLPLLSIASFLCTNSLTQNVTFEMLSLLRLDPRTPEYQNLLLKIKEDAIIFIVVAIVFQIFSAAISLCFMVAIIYTSAVSYLGKDLTIMDIFSKLKQIWLRPVITWLCSSLIMGGYAIVVILPLVLIIVLGKELMIVVAVGVVLILIAFLFNLYLTLVLVLGLVSSVLEDCCGFQAFGKGQKLMEGRKSVGCVLCFLMGMILASPICLIFVVNQNQYQTTYQILVTCFVSVFLVLVTSVSQMVYTVFYFECKKGNGEEVDIHGDMGLGEYKRLSVVPVDGSDFA